MDDFEKFLRALDDAVEIATNAQTPEEIQEIQWDMFLLMYPSFNTGMKCDDPMCGCDGNGNIWRSSAVN